MQGWSNPRFKEALPTIFFCPPDLICLSSTDLICWAQPSTINGRVWIQLMSTFKRWKAPKTSKDEKPPKLQKMKSPEKSSISPFHKSESVLETQILPIREEIYWSWLGKYIDLGWGLVGTGSLGLPQGCWLPSTSSVSRSPSWWSWWWLSCQWWWPWWWSWTWRWRRW